MKKAAVVITIAMLAALAQATVTDDLNNAELSLIDIIQRAIADRISIETVISDAIHASPAQSSLIIGAAIAVTPGSIASIVKTAIEAGTPVDVIAQHCKSALTTNEVEQIVASSMRANVRPEPIMRTCIAVVPNDSKARILAQALANADESLFDRIIISAFDAMDSSDTNAMSLVADGLVQSGVTINGYAQVNEQLAMSLVEDLVGPPAFASEAGGSPASEAEAAVLLDRPLEGSASAS